MNHRKTKKEILDHCIHWEIKDLNNNPVLTIPRKYLPDMMDEYAEQEAILFAEWISDHKLQFEPSSEKGMWIGIDWVKVTSSELFSLYKSTKEQ